MPYIDINYRPQSKMTKKARLNIFRICNELKITSDKFLMSKTINYINGEKKAPPDSWKGTNPTWKQLKYFKYLIFYSNSLDVKQYETIVSKYASL